MIGINTEFIVSMSGFVQLALTNKIIMDYRDAI